MVNNFKKFKKNSKFKNCKIKFKIKFMTSQHQNTSFAQNCDITMVQIPLKVKMVKNMKERN